MACLHSRCDCHLGEPSCASFDLVLTADLSSGDAVMVPIRNVLLLDQLRIMPPFLHCSHSQINYIKLKEVSLSSAPVSGLWFWYTDQ